MISLNSRTQIYHPAFVSTDNTDGPGVPARGWRRLLRAHHEPGRGTRKLLRSPADATDEGRPSLADCQAVQPAQWK